MSAAEAVVRQQITKPLSERERAIRRRMRDDFQHYAEKCLKIRTKPGEIVPFRMNHVQKLVHDRLEAQLATRGYVRALILKCRQPGVSTYVEGRFFHKVTHRKGLQAYILTHEDEATANLFGMADRFYEHLPELMKPHVGASNEKELYFDRLDSGYRVGTAKTKGKGRSQTLQMFHGSEVAFWPNAADHMSGILQSIAEGAPGTEIILESTANGPMGMFYNMCTAAEAGEGEYELIFVPWFAHEEYRKQPPPGWKPSTEFAEYGALHGIAPDQLYWATLKNTGMAVSLNLDPGLICWKFRQEYPATAEEAFQSADTNTFIHAEDVLRAMKTTLPAGVSASAAKVLGVDVSGGVNDKTWMIDRQGRRAGKLINDSFKERDQMVIAGRIAKLIDAHGFDMVFIDVGGGYGSGVADRLTELGYGGKISRVQFGAKANDQERYANKRAEIYGECRDWLQDAGGAELINDSELLRHLVASGWKLNSNSQFVLERKEDIKERLGFSPDGADALALTFAESVQTRVKPRNVSDLRPNRPFGL